MPRINLTNYVIWLPLIIFLVLVDQLIKAWVVSQLSPNASINLVPGIYIVMTYNSGVAFSLLANMGQNVVKSITLLAACINMALVYALGTNQQVYKNTTQQLSTALLISGGGSNLIDRLYYSAVIDYIHLSYHGWQWPTIFNLADLCICLGCAGLLLSGTRINIATKTKLAVGQ